MYSGIIYKKIKNAIKNAPYGLYVTEHYLQKVYPIKGKQCGITDSVIDYIDDSVLDKRIEHIKDQSNVSNREIGLIGSYNGNRKGLDTALKAMAIIHNSSIKLNVLYNGSEEDRNYWYDYARGLGVEAQLTFPQPRTTGEGVMSWIDTQDLIILPSRSEGLPRCIVESMSRACPCITSNVCGMPELINNKWVHNPEDVERLAFLIRDMLTNQDNQEESAKENFANSKRFLRDNLAKKRDQFLGEFKEFCMHYKK